MTETVGIMTERAYSQMGPDSSLFQPVPFHTQHLTLVAFLICAIVAASMLMTGIGIHDKADVIQVTTLIIITGLMGPVYLVFVWRAGKSAVSVQLQRRFKNRLLEKKAVKLAGLFAKLATVINAFWIFIPMFVIFQLSYRMTPFSQLFYVIPLWTKITVVLLLTLFFNGILCITLKSLLEISALLNCGVEVLLEMIQSPQPVDWDELSTKVNNLCIVAARLLNIREAGGLVMSLIATGVVMIPVGTVWAAISPFGTTMFFIGAYTALVWIGITFGTLFMLATLESRIKDAAAESSSLLAATRRYPGMRVDTNGEVLRDAEGRILVSDTSDILDDLETSTRAGTQVRLNVMTLDERWAHFRFMKFLILSPLGSEVFGIFISKSFVYESLAKVAVLVPSMVSVCKLLKARVDD